MSVRTPSFNFVAMAGNIVRDAEVKRVGDDNHAVSTLTIANNLNYRDKQGNWQTLVNFVDVELWGPPAERMEEYAKKGIPVVVEGSLREKQWKDKNNNSHSKMIIRADKVHILTYPETNSKKQEGKKTRN